MELFEYLCIRLKNVTLGLWHLSWSANGPSLTFIMWVFHKLAPNGHHFLSDAKDKKKHERTVHK